MRTAAMMSLDSSVTDSIVLTNEKINNNMANYDEVTTQLFLCCFVFVFVVVLVVKGSLHKKNRKYISLLPIRGRGRGYPPTNIFTFFS